jgi:Ribbon-helix-helix protein, copG family
VEIHRSARRYGIDDQDIRHAVDYPVVVADIDPDADPPKLLAIGPDRAGNLLEVVVLTLADGKLLVIHAMPLRRKYRGLLPGTVMTDKPKTYTTKTGKVLTDADIEQMADEAERGYDVEELKSRRRGRPMLGSAPSEVVPVRLDPDLRQAVEARAEAEHTTTSEIIRVALRRFLDVA